MRTHFFRIKTLFFFLLLLLAGTEIHAQVYPVQVAVIPTPPHRNYLNSFSEQGALNVFITLTDFNSGPISVKLKMELNGPGYQFRSLPNNLVYVLNPGQPVQIPMEDLAVFFSSSGQTLNFNPVKLPQGNTSICVDVIKNQSGELLSNNGCGYFYMGYGQPASLLQPACNSTVQVPAGSPASTDLSTIPLQFNFIPALAPIGLQQEVENTLYIYNWLGTVNTNPPVSPVGLSLALDPIELGPITAHTLLPINNQLVVGQEYVWYVKTSLNGSVNQFQNGGWSAPCKFKYGAAQSIEEALANGLSVEWVNLISQSESKGAATWKVVKEDPNSTATFNQFILKYRKKVPAGEEPFEWFSDTVNDLSKAIYQLEPATTYEASVSGKLGSFVSEPTEVRTFTTAPPRTFSCGVANFPGRATAFQPLDYADPGMKVKIGMFQLEFVSVQNTGQPGHFSGTGLIPVDFLFGAEARVKFDDLKIDKEYDVWEGTAHVITEGLDSWLEDQYQQFQDPIYVNGTVDSAYVSDSIAHVIIDGVDTTFTFPCATCPVIINDVAGNQITIYPNGTVIWSSYLDVSDEQLNVPDSEIAVFEQNTQETGGFDPFEHIEWNANYEIIRTSNAVNYFVANKSVKKGQTDKVSLSVPENKYTATNVGLSWPGQATPLAPASSSVSNGKRVFVFDLPAFNSDDEFAMYAVSDNLKIGKLNVVVYEAETKNVVIVPIASTSISASNLETYLDKIYGGAGFDWNVRMEQAFTPDSVSLTETILVSETTQLQKYSEQMKRIRKSYFSTREEESNTHYLFVVNTLADSAGNQINGYTPRGKMLGFIAQSSSLDVYAHELGHGCGLAHTWLNNGPALGQTRNLLDYSDADLNQFNLVKWQWHDLRNPSFLPSFWDDTEDAEVAGGTVYYYDVLVESDGNGGNRIVRRSYCANKTYIKNGNANCVGQPVGYITGVNKYWKYVNGVKQVISYEHFGKVFYVNEIVNCDAEKVRFGDHYGSNTLKYYPGDPGKSAPGVYEVRPLYLSGRPEPYRYEVRNSKLLPVINHLDNYEGEYKMNIFLNDLEVSNDFRTLYKKYTAKELSYEELVLFFHNHPKYRYDPLCFNTEQKQAEASHFKGGTNDPETGRYHPPSASNWYVENMPVFYMGNSTLGKSGYESGLSVRAIIKNGDVYTRETISIEASGTSQATSYSIHKAKGVDNCHHSLQSVDQQIDWLKVTLDNLSEHDIEDIVNYISTNGYCMLYDLELSYRKKLLKAMADDDGSWVMNDQNMLSLVWKTAEGQDEVDMLEYLEGNATLMKTLFARLEDTWEPDDADLNALKRFFSNVCKDLNKYKLAKFPQSGEFFEKSFSSDGYVDPLRPITTQPEIYTVKFASVDIPVVLGTKGVSNEIILGKLDLGINTEQLTSYGYNSGIKLKTFSEQTDNNIELDDNGKISITQDIGIYEYYDGLYFTSAGNYNGENEIFRVYSTYTLEPYDYVTVVIAENYGMTNFNKGDIIQMPAICALLIQQAIDNQQFDEGFRVVTDIVEVAAGMVAIVSAPVTGGQSVVAYVSIVGSIKASVDLVVFSNQYGSTSEEYNSEFYKNWQVISSIVDVADGIVNLPGLIKGGIKIGGKCYNQFKGIALAIALNRSIKVTNLADNVADISKSMRARTISYALRSGLKYADAYEFISNTGDAWLLWSQYAKTIINGEELAIVGNRYFSRAAVESMVPSGLGGAGIPPSIINDILNTGEKAAFNGKFYNSSLDAVVMTENNGTIVRSITKVSDRTAETGLGLTNAFKGTSLELEAATARIKEVRSKGGSAGNYGYLYGTVKGEPINHKIWASGQVVGSEPQIFDAIEVAGSNGVPFLRNTDSEYKMLNQLAFDLGGVKGNAYTNVTGELKIVSELPFCTSCRGIIKQFNEMFPNIEIIVVNGAR